MTDKGLLTPIAELILRENDNLAIAMPVTDLKEVDLYFFRVFRLYALQRTYDSELTELASGGTVDFNYLGDTGIGTGKNILEVYERFPFRMLHYGIGGAPGEVWLYKAQPPDVQATGFGYEVEAPKVGDKRDYVPFSLSPLDTPTRLTESIVFHKFTAHYGLYNSSARTIRPNLRILGAGYDCVQITSRRFIDAMLNGRKPCRILTAGSLRTFTYDVPDTWKPPVRVDRELIERLMEGS